MPQRLLRPGIRTSKRFNRCDWFPQTFYLRLVTLVDDHGRYEGDPELLRSEAFPYGGPTGDQLPVELIARALQHLSAAQLLLLYEFEGKQYLQLLRWKERVRSESKYPAPPKTSTLQTSDSTCQQMIASPPKPEPEPKPTPKPEPAARTCAPAPAMAALPTSDAQTATAAARAGTCVRVNLKKILPDKRTHANGETTHELMAQLNAFYGRPTDFRWSYEEEHLAASTSKRPCVLDELKLLVWHKSKLPQKRFFPQSILKLLSGWTEHLDKARLAQRHPSMRGE